MKRVELADASATRGMRITDVKTILLTGPCTSDPYLSQCRKRRSAAFIEIHTDGGAVGLGETYGGYFCPELIPPAVELFKPVLIGKDAQNIEQLWNWMYHCENFWGRVGLGPIVLSGIEAALWDLKGKLLGLPVWQLLGGPKHDSLECYATGGPSNYPIDELARKIDFYLSLGFRAFKLGVGTFTPSDGPRISGNPVAAAELESDKLAFVRRHVGKDVKVMLDGHMGNTLAEPWDLATAQAVCKAVVPFDLHFFEEPLHYTNPSGYAELCKSTGIPIAGGECLSCPHEWRGFVERDCFDIGQPDASFAGGLGPFMKIAAMLESRGRKLATHCWGAGGSLMQNIHCGFAAANTLILEIPPAFGPLHSEIVGDSFVMRDGRIVPPQTPGLGIELTEKVRRNFPFVPGSGEFNDVPGKVLTD